MPAAPRRPIVETPRRKPFDRTWSLSELLARVIGWQARGRIPYGHSRVFRASHFRQLTKLGDAGPAAGCGRAPCSKARRRVGPWSLSTLWKTGS